jgi:hypothetical protein
MISNAFVSAFFLFAQPSTAGALSIKPNDDWRPHRKYKYRCSSDEGDRTAGDLSYDYYGQEHKAQYHFDSTGSTRPTPNKPMCQGEPKSEPDRASRNEASRKAKSLLYRGGYCPPEKHRQA